MRLSRLMREAKQLKLRAIKPAKRGAAPHYQWSGLKHQL
jgi:hypothetical protein